MKLAELGGELTMAKTRITLCFLMMLSSAALGQTREEESSSDLRSIEFELSGILRDRDLDARPTAEELLRALRTRRPLNPTILPGSMIGQPLIVENKLWPEGTSIVTRGGYLREDDTWWVFEFDPAKGDRPIKLLPNTSLEVMVRSAAAADTPIHFLISGETTVFAKENYLLVRVVRRDTQQTKPSSAVETPEATTEVVPSQRLDGGSKHHPNANLVGASAQDMIKALQHQRPKELVINPTSSSFNLKLRGALPAANVKPDGSPLVSRAGRVMRDGEWWTLHLESSNPNHPETPFKLLPNHTVEQMIVAAQGGNRHAVFIVSGEITLFDGENYMLPTMALQRVDDVNLHP